MTPATWEAALGEAGFETVDVIPGDETPGAMLSGEHSLIVATAGDRTETDGGVRAVEATGSVVILASEMAPGDFGSQVAASVAADGLPVLAIQLVSGGGRGDGRSGEDDGVLSVPIAECEAAFEAAWGDGGALAQLPGPVRLVNLLGVSGENASSLIDGTQGRSF